MADINNFSEITENFDTIKTLLNSIRAQGILNTSDVDKLLAGINSKLERLNTEEDIDLIKIFLSELKQNLDERHNVLLSKFGAIESLFSNLLKNSADALKSSEVKELFDIVATNLSVFSREVVSQKETLTDITLRLDAMRSDDSQKKDIIKNISLLKNDLERLNNGFDSIILSLNENFKTIIKTISSIDQTDAITQFGHELADIANSSNTVLSALQVLDKKSTQLEEALKSLATQDDITSAKKWLSDLVTQNHELAGSIDILADKYYKIDNLAEKIDASVNIIAGLKTVLADNDEQRVQTVLNKLDELETFIKEVSSNQSFEEFKSSLETVLKDISDGSVNLQNAFVNASSEIQKINDGIQALDINVNFQSLNANLIKMEHDIKEQVDVASDKVSQLVDVNVTRTINEISSSAEALDSRLKETYNAISNLCGKNFSEVMDDISALRTVVAQIDENNVSANNAIFSNITDRLAIFENSLKTSLEKQEEYVANSSNQLIEQVTEIKNLSGVLDYKLDASVIEVNNSKREFSELKSAVQDILALDFVNVVKDLRVDLYASKQELSTAIETSANDVSDKLSNDLFGKYELLISKLDSVEDELKQVQSSSLAGLKSILDNISASIVDVLSYVSVKNEVNTDAIDIKLANIAESVKESNLNYVENVRDVVEVIRTQVENNLIQVQKEMSGQIGTINASIVKSTESLRDEIKYSYNKLLEVQDNFDELKEAFNVNSVTLSTNVGNIMESADNLRSDFEIKLAALKNALLDKVAEFKQDFTCENADKISELRFTSENLHSKAVQNSIDLKNELRNDIAGIIDNLKLNITSLAEQLAGTTLNIEGANKEIVNYIKNDFCAEVDNSVDVLKTNISDFTSDMDAKIDEVVRGFSGLESSVDNLASTTTSSLTATLAQILDNFVSLKALMNSLDEKSANDLKNSVDVIINDFAALRDKVDIIDNNIDEDLTRQLSIIETGFETLTARIGEMFKQGDSILANRINIGFADISGKMQDTVADKLEQYKSQVESLFDGVIGKNDAQAEFIKEKVLELNSCLETAIEKQNKTAVAQLEGIAYDLKKVLDENIELTSADYNGLKVKLDNFASNIEQTNINLISDIKAQLDDVAKFVDSGLDIQAQEVNSKFDEISSKVQAASGIVNELNTAVKNKIDEIKDSINTLKIDVSNSVSDKSALVINRLEEISEDLSYKNNELMSVFMTSFNDMKGVMQASFSAETSDIRSSLDEKIEEVRGLIDSSSSYQQNNILVQAKNVLDEIQKVKAASNEQFNSLRSILAGNFTDEINALYNKVLTLFEEHSLNFITQLCNSETKAADDLNAKTLEFKAAFEALNERLDKDEISQMNVFQSQLRELSNTFNVLIDEAKNVTKSEVSAISETLIQNSKSLMEDVEQSIEDKVNSILASSADIAAGELQSMEMFTNKILEQVENAKQNSIACKNMINDFIKKEFEIVAGNIEKETDVIVKDLIEQFSIMKDSQKDELSKLEVHVESSIEDYIFNYINDLKSYLDIKTDSTVINNKLDNLRTELERSADDVLANINKLLEVSVFTSTISDLKQTNEVLVTSMAEKLNKQVQEFVQQNVTQKLDDKLNLFDKKFIDTVVDKYEEIKLISSRYNNSFETIEASVQDLVSKFVDTKNEISENLHYLVGGINNSINELNRSFADLKAQILNKSFDEAFQASINNQIAGIETLVNEQMGYLEDISELCCNNLPEITEMNTIVKYGIQEAVAGIASKLDAQDAEVEKALTALKSDIITQFLNIFNQISFVAEQEEILDFIQEKHSDLITILSHIVTTVDSVENVKDNLAVVDNKMDALKEDIDLINEKITSIISSEGDINYVYSLQDIESDIANLRLVLNDIKEDNKSKEFEELISSTNDIYKLVESIKTELPKFEAEEFKRDFEALSEDIVSISTRTNKLILASDESYKTLQDNLQDFKLVINDLDERTRNFAQEAGIDRIDNKLGSINAMIQNGAKTNQVFNQVFEYLAEWVDKAGEQITTISDKVETLDDIGQIKVMLEDLKAEAEDNTESTELIEALGNVFDKQTKKISSLEAKLDRVIVETTISNKNNKLDMTPMEDTLNRFLAAIDERMAGQQAKINSLESKLEEVMSLIDPKDTAQLTKKVGGMDRQIAKLNKSIEKIASHVVEK